MGISSNELQHIQSSTINSVAIMKKTNYQYTRRELHLILQRNINRMINRRVIFLFS